MVLFVEGIGDEEIFLYIDKSVVECEVFHEFVDTVDWIVDY